MSPEAAEVTMNPVLWGGVTAAISYVKLDTEGLIEHVRRVDENHPILPEIEKVREVLDGIARVVMTELGSGYYEKHRDDFVKVTELIGSVRDTRHHLKI